MKRQALRTRYGRSSRIVPGTNVEFGKEHTPAECRARAAYERERAALLSTKGSNGRILASGHLQAARDYEWLARKREGAT